ncbi:MAG: hypothetical protein LIR50_21360 [Bacillota bacterium]|nr:hypothetical protein [Bacillota bacterium]
MKVNKRITFSLTIEEDEALCTVITMFNNIANDATVSQEIRAHASTILNDLYVFNDDYFED